MRSWLFGTIILSSSMGVAQYNPQPELNSDPYARAVGAPNYEVHIRILNRGISVSEADLQRQIHAAELIYSQCPGVRMRIVAEKGPETEGSTLQDNLTGTYEGKWSLTESFFDFFEPLFSLRTAGVVDVHLVDHMDSDWRLKERPRAIMTTLGMAFRKENLGTVVVDLRENQVPSAAELAGDSVVLAMKTLEASNGVWTRGQVKVKTKQMDKQFLYGFKSFHHSLLAHELGHILLEGQDISGGVYKDHYCTGIEDDCPPENLMSGGGYKDKVYYTPPLLETIAGYSPLPQIESAQCEALLKHPLVHQIQ